MVTSPPYHVGKEYDSDLTFGEYLELLRSVFKETYRVLEPGGRAVVNVANLGRRPYVSLADHVAVIMEDLKKFPCSWRGHLGKGEGCLRVLCVGQLAVGEQPDLSRLARVLPLLQQGAVEPGSQGSEHDKSRGVPRGPHCRSGRSLPSRRACRVSHPAPFPVALPWLF